MGSRDLVKSIFINDVNVKFQSNSFVQNPGGGENNIEAFNKGNAEVEVVVATDFSTKLGMVKFEMANTKDSRDDIAGWVAAVENLIQVVYESGDIKTFESMILVKDPDQPGGSDTNFEVEFQGAPAK